MTLRDNDDMTTATLEPITLRIFDIEGSPNIRHMGGYETRHGGVTGRSLDDSHEHK